MQNLKFLNKKEIKNILDLIRKQWDCDAKLDYVFSMNEKGKIYIVNREISEIDLSKLRISSIGLYFGTLVEGSSLRLSIEGSQLVGPKAKKNVVELSEKELKEWLKGIDIDKDTKEKGFVIIRYKDDFIGCGKAVDKRILNYVPKARRISSSV